MDSQSLNPNLLALLSQGIQSHVGINGQAQLPGFSGGQGLNPNMLSLLLAGGQLPKHQDMNGQFILPNAPGSSQTPTFGGLDSYQALQRGEGSGLIKPQTQPSSSMLPNGFGPNSATMGQQSQYLGGAMQAGMNPELFPGMFGPIAGMGRALGANAQYGRTRKPF